MSDPSQRIPSLRGIALKRRGAGYAYPDGTPVAEADVAHIVYVLPSTHDAAAPMETHLSAAPPLSAWWSAVDAGSASSVFAEPPHGDALSAVPQPGGQPEDARSDDPAGISSDDLRFALRAVASEHHPLPVVEFDAAFFHRTLARWMGLSVEGMPPDEQGPSWDYDFWKAELVEESVTAGERRAQSFRHVYRVMVHRGEHTPPEHYRYWIEVDAAGRLSTSGWLSEAPDLLAEDDHEASTFAPPAPSPDVLEALFAAPET